LFDRKNVPLEFHKNFIGKKRNNSASNGSAGDTLTTHYKFLNILYIYQLCTVNHAAVVYFVPINNYILQRYIAASRVLSTAMFDKFCHLENRLWWFNHTCSTPADMHVTLTNKPFDTICWPNNTIFQSIRGIINVLFSTNWYH